VDGRIAQYEMAYRMQASVPELIAAAACRQIRIHVELVAQMRKIIDAGIHPTHLDTHKHTHLAPPVLDAVARISDEFDVPWVRRPFDLPMTAGAHRITWLKRFTSDRLRFLERRFQQTLERNPDPAGLAYYVGGLASAR
jgi:predicted glycoside hydrolase/deacetylase ChbG (UPF0249 family)